MSDLSMLEKAHAYLSKTDAGGVSLYDHLVDLVSATLEANPDNVAVNVEKVPAFSQERKKNRFQPFGTRSKEVHRQLCEPDSRIVERCQGLTKLFKKPAETVTVTIEKPVPSTTVTTTVVKPKPMPKCKSVMLESRFFNAIGVGLPEEECFLLDLSIAQLAGAKKLKNVRFVGKIFGLQANYFVVESDHWYPDKDHKNYVEKYAMAPPPRRGVPMEVQPEPSGKGLNRYSYWVCSHPSAPWTVLPDVTPQQINAARQIKKFFTGNLDAELRCYPEFPGKEIHYLRAQLARITAATTISPVGALQEHGEDDEEEEEEPEEEGQPPKPKEQKTRPLTDPVEGFGGESLEEGIRTLANPQQWCHHYEYVYKTGRATLLPEKEEEEEPEEEEEEDLEAKPKEEPKKDLLQPVSRDKLYVKIVHPKEETGEEGEEEEEAEAAEEEPAKEEEKEDADEEAEEEAPEGEEEDPRVKRVTAWVFRLKNALYKNHGIVMGKSLRWPGAYVYAAEKGKAWGTIYLGNGVKASSLQFAPTPAPPVVSEPADLPERRDPSAKAEKLLLRGEELPEKDSEQGDEPEAEEEPGEEGEDQDN